MAALLVLKLFFFFRRKLQFDPKYHIIGLIKFVKFIPEKTDANRRIHWAIISAVIQIRRSDFESSTEQIVVVVSTSWREKSFK